MKTITYTAEEIGHSGWAAELKAVVIPGQSIQIAGVDTNNIHGPVAFDLTFKIGDEAEYDSYNLSYTGKIVSIGPKTVTIEHYGRKSRLSLYTFVWRNHDFDSAKIAASNAETMRYI